MSTCLFCKILAKEIPAAIVHQDDQVTAFRDINPQAPVHILVCPNRHIESLNQIGSEDGLLLGRLIQMAVKIAAQEKIDTSGYRLVVNTKRGAGQSVFHLHIHLLGGRQMHWPPG